MSKFIAVLVVCLGTVSLWAGGKGPQPGQKQTQGGSKHNSRPQPQFGSSVQKSPQPSPAQEQTDFYGSWIAQGARFVWINPGAFHMGSTKETDRDRNSDEVRHPVWLTRGFWLLDHEVTQKEYRWVMGVEKDPSEFKGDARPVEQVTWYEAVEFCEKLTKMDRDQGRIRQDQAYRLPTEAEWEYAARAGTTGARYTVDGLGPADSLDRIAWYDGNSGDETHAVKGKKPNAWGLYDMIGNVWEWCSDWYGDYPTGFVEDPTGSITGSSRVHRGGGWSLGAWGARSASRNSNDPGDRVNDLGFRPALSSVR